jgi:hypothetical protein
VHEWTKGAPKGAPLLFETFTKKQRPLFGWCELLQPAGLYGLCRGTPVELMQADAG